MTFLNAVLLGGMAAVTIPIIIHLFHRSKFRIVPWGAMHLLESVLRKNTRRLKLEQLLLLLLRCSIPVFLAICMARPVLTGLEPLLGNAKSSTILLIDNSYSMEAGGPANSNFQQAREAARQILDSQVPGSDVAIIQMAGGVSSLLDDPTFDLDRMRGELGKLKSGYGSAELPRSLELARTLLPKMHNTHRDIVILSDMQRVSWSDQEAPARANVVDQLKKQPVPPSLSLFQVGKEVTENVSMDRVVPSRQILGVGQKLNLHAHLKNHGEAGYQDLKVVFRVDGKEKAVTQTVLEPHQEAQALFPHVFETSGSHVIEVYADADPLTADNGMMMSIPVWDRVPVLLVSGDLNPEPLRGATDFVEIALTPHRSAKSELADLIETRVLEARDLEPRALGEARVVLLANVSQLTDPQLRALEAFVREGGGLLIFPGNRINSAWYNTTLSTDGKGLLPLPVVSLAGSLNQSGTQQATIVAQHYEHPALEMFNDPKNGNMSDAQVWLWYKMRGDQKNLDSSTTVLARFDSGDPFLVEKNYGEGRVIQCAIPCDANWSNLPMRPFYLPLMQQLVTYLASKVYPPRNVEVGKPLVALFPLQEAGKKAVMTDPEGKTTELAVVPKGTRSAVEYASTQRPGLYLLDLPGGNRIHFVVNTDRKESDLRQLGEEELGRLSKGMEATLVRSWAEYRDHDQKRRFGQEVWQSLLVAVLGLLFFEMVLEQLFARRTR